MSATMPRHLPYRAQLLLLSLLPLAGLGRRTGGAGSMTMTVKTTRFTFLMTSLCRVWVAPSAAAGLRRQLMNGHRPLPKALAIREQPLQRVRRRQDQGTVPQLAQVTLPGQPLRAVLLLFGACERVQPLPQMRPPTLLHHAGRFPALTPLWRRPSPLRAQCAALGRRLAWRRLT
jgi:hypothetical protein